MSKLILTFGYGVLLAVLGAGAYWLSQFSDVVALVPTAFGLMVLGLGMGMMVRLLQVHAYYLGAIVALAAFATGIPSVGRTITWTFGPGVMAPGVHVAWTIMSVVSMVYLVLMLRGFVLPAEEHPEEGA